MTEVCDSYAYESKVCGWYECVSESGGVVAECYAAVVVFESSGKCECWTDAVGCVVRCDCNSKRVVYGHFSSLWCLDRECWFVPV